LADLLAGHNYGEVEEFCLSVTRRAVIDKKTNNAKGITDLKLRQWKKRLVPDGGDDKYD
ncbi:MAG: AAA family ATPase, partial [bacterium]|nr:AAA family ATPase [bacterium]